jgi:hypothetical protein
VFWVISVYFTIRNTLLKCGTFLLGHPNLSLTTGIYPDWLKYANIIPCFKKGSITEISNYRPISLLTGFSKIFEILICNRIKLCLTNNKVTVDNQFGFSKGGSMQKAIFTVIDYIKKNPWPQSTRELYRPNDRRLSAKLVPTFCG